MTDRFAASYQELLAIEGSFRRHDLQFDFRKLAFFQSWVAVRDPGWALTLRTCPVDAEQLSATESAWTRRLEPLVNGTGRPDDSASTIVEDAFSQYFSSFFSGRLVVDG